MAITGMQIRAVRCEGDYYAVCIILMVYDCDITGYRVDMTEDEFFFAALNALEELDSVVSKGDAKINKVFYCA